MKEPEARTLVHLILDAAGSIIILCLLLGGIILGLAFVKWAWGILF
jgi:hypothetical protein